MKKITVFMNDPPGSRCLMNRKIAQWAAREFGAQLEIISEGSPEYKAHPFHPTCPAVAVDDEVIVENGMISYEKMQEAVED